MKNQTSRKQNSAPGNSLSKYKDNKGIVLIAALCLLAVLAIAGTSAVVTTTTDIKINSNYQSGTKTFYAAEGGAKYGVEKLRQKLNTVLNPSTSDLSSITAPTIDGYSFDDYSVLKVGTANTKEITIGNFTGLTARNQKYDIVSNVKQTGNNPSRAKVVLTAEDSLIPLFQFGIFYQDDLEMLPGADMTYNSSGKIHSNSDIYLGANTTLSIDSKITSAGDIFNRRKDDGTVPSGTVRIKDGNGNYQAMKVGNNILDNSKPNWTQASIQRWNGKVQSKDHGIVKLNIPLPVTSGPIEVIKRGDTIDPTKSAESSVLFDARFYWKAGLRIIDNTFYDRSGKTLDITNGGTVTTPLSTESIYDAREGKNITLKTIDIAKLKTNAVAINALNNSPSGILYISGTETAIRLINGSSIPSGGLTIASDKPVYIKGDYNVGNLPAAVASDAVTILSNNWYDSKSGQSLSNRVASNTTVKTVIMAGHVPTNGSQYSGGVENFPRFLENWSGMTFTYCGSLISLWHSEIATGKWKYGDPVYTAPVRNWSFGIDFDKLPPGTPYVRMIQKVGWKQDIN